MSPRETVLSGLVLAAGSASRFGSQKLLADLAGRPLLEHALGAMSAAPVDRVVCVLGSEAEAILAAVDMKRAEPVVCPDWREGQAASLRTGVDALSDADVIVVTLGDQPLITADAIRRVIAGRDPGAAATRAAYKGVPGHPVLLERRIFGELLGVHGDVGARDLLNQLDVSAVACDDLGSPFDVDTEEDLRSLPEGTSG